MFNGFLVILSIVIVFLIYGCMKYLHRIYLKLEKIRFLLQFGTDEDTYIYERHQESERQQKREGSFQREFGIKKKIKKKGINENE